MQDKNSFMTPISRLAMYFAMAPFIAMKYGYLPFTFLSLMFVYGVFNAYQYYTKKANEKNITYLKALEEDLPNMSPIHYIFFILIAAPIFFMTFGDNIVNFIGVGIIWIVYTIYYYGFKDR